MVTDLATFTRLVASQTQVAPLNKKTIPTLELLNVVFLSRLVVYVREALEKSLVINKPCCWTDSLVSLYWITVGVKGLKTVCAEPC